MLHKRNRRCLLVQKKNFVTIFHVWFYIFRYYIQGIHSDVPHISVYQNNIFISKIHACRYAEAAWECSRGSMFSCSEISPAGISQCETENTIIFAKSLKCGSRMYAKPKLAWRCKQVETYSALLELCERNSPVTGEFPSQRAVTRSFDVSLICAWVNGKVNNRKAGDLRRHRAHYDVTVMVIIMPVDVIALLGTKPSAGIANLCLFSQC